MASAEFEFNPGNNLICGPNASGKTSILEAIAYLGRGRSFRGASTAELIRHGADEFLLLGKVNTGSREVALGVRNSINGLEVHSDGEKRNSAAALAEALPLQVIDPDVHELVAGGPENRRKYLDWIAFHVEHGYLGLWRRYRRALKQRNAALKQGTNGQGLESWDQELAELGVELDAARRRMLDIAAPALGEFGEALLGSPVRVEYQQGWRAERSLLESLSASAERDLLLGSTQSGPHRADLRLIYDERKARRHVSRGQQKLLASSLILAATEIAQNHLERPLVVLLDDPSAELDQNALNRLMNVVGRLGSQVIATTLDPDRPLFAEPPTLFHVEQGVVSSSR